MKSLHFRLANPPDSLYEQYSEKEQVFYEGLAEFASNILNSEYFQTFLENLIGAEWITTIFECDRVIWIFPQRITEDSLVGGFVTQDCKRVAIVPGSVIPIAEYLTWDLIGDFFDMSKESMELWKIRELFAAKVIGLCIHETLHLKYKGKEDTVRDLTGKYLEDFGEYVGNIPLVR